MPSFIKNKFFMVIVVLMIILTVVPSVMAAVGAGDYVRNAVNVVVSPLKKLFSYSADALSGYAAYFTEFDDIVEENKELKNELRDLKERISDAEEIEKMNDWLYNYLELRREHPDYKFAGANVTGRESGNYMTVFTLDKGTSSGIAAGMSAVTENGIVGYVKEVGKNWCKVVTLLESDTAVGAYVQRTEDIGVVEGDFTLASEGLCRMLYVSADSEIRSGDRIITSGYGSVYPKGLLIGTVERVEPDPNTQTLVAYVRPSEPMKDIRALMIITDYEVVADE